MRVTPQPLESVLENLGVVSWNVAGITGSLLCSFLLNLSFHCPWSVLCLQEAFTKTERPLSSSSLDGTDGHKHFFFFFTPKEVKKGLRAPAIVVRDMFAQKCVLLGSGLRWVAVLFTKLCRIFVSLHLQHSRLLLDLSLTTLHELRQQLMQFPGRMFFCLCRRKCEISGLLGRNSDR